MIVGGAIASNFHSALAQSKIVPDRTLGAESSIVTPLDASGRIDVIDGGAIRGDTGLFSVSQPSSSNLLIARLNAQLTGDSLLSLERFSIGGIGTVRGYRQNELVTDNGIGGSFEVRFPVTNKI